MKVGTKVTILTPLWNDVYGHRRYGGIRGTFHGRAMNGDRVVRDSGGTEHHLPKGGPVRITTKRVDISPLGLVEF